MITDDKNIVDHINFFLILNRAALEAKAKLYDRLTKPTRTDSDDEEDNDDDPRYMVDFQRKVLEVNTLFCH